MLPIVFLFILVFLKIIVVTPVFFKDLYYLLECDLLHNLSVLIFNK